MALRVTPLGNGPVSVKVGAGKPVAVTVKVPAVPTVKVGELPEVMAGAWSTVSVKLWVAFGSDAVGGGDGDRVGPAGAGCRGAGQDTGGRVRVTPPGSVPVSVKVGAGKPVAVTVKVPAVPTVKVVALPEVMDGAWIDGQREALGGIRARRRWRR